MSYQNPTPVQVGMAGAFADQRYQVVGRVVLSTAEGGEQYSWNEFNLVGADGRLATLVYEEGERGGEWRMFTLFEPTSPLTAKAAAVLRPGARLNLDGKWLRVTLVGESRVRYIEGEAPEGVEVGDVARYLNAQAGRELVVVSWTGEEVECYRGLDLPAGMVAAAFGLPTEKLVAAVAAPSRAPSALRWIAPVVGVCLLGGIPLMTHLSRGSRVAAEAAVKPKTPASPLSVGSRGKLGGTTYRIRGHVVTEVAQVGLRYDRHEYHLFDEAGSKALLIYDPNPRGTYWFLFSPVSSPAALTPHQAAAKRVGDHVDWSGATAKVTEIFRCAARQIRGDDFADLTVGTVWYGWRGWSDGKPLLALWNESGITCYEGQALPAREVTNALSDQRP